MLTLTQALGRIQELEAQLAEAKEALEPFVTVPGLETLKAHDAESVRIPVRWGNLRRAARAYGKLTDGG